MSDLTKVIFDSSYNAFKNNNIYTGTLSITGTTSAGTNSKTFNVSLSESPDFLDIIFTGPSDALDSTGRPDDVWFKQGAVWVLGTDSPSYVDLPTPWVITTKLSGSTVVVTATFVQQFVASLSLDSTDFSYRIIDYSVL